jgi:hypothetical protein
MSSHKAITAVCNGPLSNLVAAEGMRLRIKNEKNEKIYTVLNSCKKMTHTIKVEREVMKNNGNPNSWKNSLSFTVLYADPEMNTVPENIEDIITDLLEHFNVNPFFYVTKEEDRVDFAMSLNETPDMVNQIDMPRVVFDPLAIDSVIYNVFWHLLGCTKSNPLDYIPGQQPANKKKRKSHQISEDGAGYDNHTESEVEDDGPVYRGEVNPGVDMEEMPVVQAELQIDNGTGAASVVEAQARIVQDVPVGTSIVEAQARIVQDVPVGTSIVEAQARIVQDVPADIPIVSAEPIMSDVDLQTFVNFTLGRGNGPSLAEPALTGVAEAVQTMVAPVPAGVAEAGPAEAQSKPDPVQDPKTEILRLLMEDDVDRGAIMGLLDLLEEKKKLPDLKVYETDVLVKIINEATTEMQSRISMMAKKEEVNKEEANKDSNGESKEEPEVVIITDD